MTAALIDWCRDPRGAPPLPFASPVVGVASDAYAIGALPARLLLDELGHAGVSYSPGRGNGYRIRGAPADRYRVGDVVADVFADAARTLAHFLESDPQSEAIRRAARAADAIGFADRPEVHAARAAASRGLEAEERIFAAERQVDYPQLAIQAASLASTARSIRVHQSVRFEAVRRFVQPLAPPSATPDPSSPADVRAFLASLPPRRLKRSALPALAADAGLVIGDRTLYGLAQDVLGTPTRNRGEWFFHPARYDPTAQPRTARDPA